MNFGDIVAAQRAYFATGATRPVQYRLEALGKLRAAVADGERRILEALRADLNKSGFEGYMTEVGMVLEELRYAMAHVRRWAAGQRVPTPLAQFPARSLRMPEPYGAVLIMAPWNYPFQLSLTPLVGALAAGNCAVVKPSAYASRTSAVIAELLADCFGPEYVAVVEGGRQENDALLNEAFDYIFFTGSAAVGRLVMERASRHLTPVSLELGGKSPCIIDDTADIPVAARRVAFGKFLNAGQTCVAPDYLFVHARVKDRTVESLRQSVAEFYGPRPLDNPDYPRIINGKHFDRLRGLMEGENILLGGQWNDRNQIAPTLLDGVTADSPVMGEEIFGPILPILTYEDIGEVIAFVSGREKPLALYLFTRDRDTQRRVLSSLSFGGGCVNDTIIHLASSRLPFGGVGASGMGSYHGKFSFDTFSHYKSIVKKAFWLDLPMRYFPASDGKLKLIRRFLH